MDATPPVPIISLGGEGDESPLGPKILDAVVQTGFFYLADHGITPQEIDLLFSQSAEFFLHEPEAERVRCQDRNNNTGYTAMQQEQLDPTSRAGGDLKESFYLAGLSRAEGGSSSVDPQYRPPSQMLPPTLAQHREAISTFIEKCKGICDAVLAGFAEAIDLPSNFFTDSHHGQHDRLRLIHYPPTPIVDPDAESTLATSIRAGSHSDYGSCTLLFQKDVGGLQVETKPQQWVDIPPQKGCIVVNVGDAMEFWSAGLFRSTQHRVVLPRSASESGSRFSVAYFCQPDEDARLVPLDISDNIREKCRGDLMARDEFQRRCAAKGVSNAAELTGGQHLRARLTASYRPTRS